ncbi:MAG: hypothetical protein FWF05_01630 [Oscillospiraceae bacterium]|nr:hypothetical protein [Oscillospiraceae bacterium]
MRSKTIKLLAVLLLLCTVFAMSSCGLFSGDSEETETTTMLILAATPIPDSKEGVVNYFNTLMNGVKAARPGVEKEVKRELSSVKASNAKGDIPEVGSLIAIAKGYIKDLETKKDTAEYGANLNDFLPLKGTGSVSLLTADDVISATCADEEIERNGQKETDLKYYRLTLKLDPNSDMAKIFDIDGDKSAALDKFQDYTDNVTVSDYGVEFTEDCSVTLKIFKEKDYVIEAVYVKSMVISSDVVFNGELADWGEANVSFVLKETTVYKNFVWEEPTTVPAA